MNRLLGRHYATGEAIQLTVADRITAVEPLSPGDSSNDLPWIAPGLIDLQVNGYGGVEFNDPGLNVDQVEFVCRELLAQGTTSFLATCTTDSQAHFVNSFRTIAAACAQRPQVAASLVGIHVEGPHISPEDGPRGAHPRAHVRPPSWDEFQELQAAADGRVKLVTLSPEYDTAPAFIRQAVASGVRVAIGHTNATTEQIAAAVAAGTTLSTHLGNGAHPLLRRHPNYIWDQLAEDQLVASLIVDGHHLPPAVVKAMVRAKTPQRIILVSDLTGRAGLPPGVYDTPLGQVELLPEGKLVVAGQRAILAGAAMPLPGNIPRLQRFAELDRGTAIDCATLHPARYLGWNDVGLRVGDRANLVLFHETPREGIAEWQIIRTVQRGREVFTAG